jgi:hypothetical protein
MLRCNTCSALVFANGIGSQQRIKTLRDFRLHLCVTYYKIMSVVLLVLAQVTLYRSSQVRISISWSARRQFVLSFAYPFARDLLHHHNLYLEMGQH